MHGSRTPDPEAALVYRELAASCFRQAAATLNPTTAATLRMMAEEYIAKARAVDPSLPDAAAE